MTKSEYTCPNCDTDYDIDMDGDRIQPCPERGSREIIKSIEAKNEA